MVCGLSQFETSRCYFADRPTTYGSKDVALPREEGKLIF